MNFKLSYSLGLSPSLFRLSKPTMAEVDYPMPRRCGTSVTNAGWEHHANSGSGCVNCLEDLERARQDKQKFTRPCGQVIRTNGYGRHKSRCETCRQADPPIQKEQNCPISMRQQEQMIAANDRRRSNSVPRDVGSPTKSPTKKRSRLSMSRSTKNKKN